MYSCGPLHKDEQKQDNQLEPTYSSCVPLQDVTLKTCWKHGLEPHHQIQFSIIPRTPQIVIHVFTQRLSYRQEVTQSPFWSGVKLICIQSFPSPRLVAFLNNLPFYLAIAGERRDGYMPFPRGLATSENLTTLSRIWTKIAKSISYDDKHYAKCTFKLCFMYFLFYPYKY